VVNAENLFSVVLGERGRKHGRHHREVRDNDTSADEDSSSNVPLGHD
jgi:hypothetical protein